MSNDLTTTKEWSREQVDLIKSVVADGASDDDLKVFLYQAKKSGLDPFTQQIRCIKMWDPGKDRYVWSTQTSIDGLRTIAGRTGKYRGPTPQEWCGEDGKWVDVWLEKGPPTAARIGVRHADFEDPVYAVAKFSSYAKTKKTGELTKTWRTMPDVMLSKCAEALALRKAFPQDLSGLYTTDEMGRAGNSAATSVAPEPVKQITSPSTFKVYTDEELTEIYYIAETRGWTTAKANNCISKGRKDKITFAELCRKMEKAKGKTK